MTEKENDLSSFRNLSSKLCQSVPIDSASKAIMKRERVPLVIDFHESVQFRLVSMASALESLGFHVETVLFRGCCVFASCPVEMNPATYLDGVPEIVSWKEG